MRGSVFLLFMVAGCGGAPDEPAVVGEDVSPLEVEPGVRVHRQRESQAPLRFSLRNLLDHHGGVLPASTTYAIWWGDQSAFPADAKDGIASLLDGLDTSGFLGIAGQYMRGQSVTTTFVDDRSLVDTSAPPAGAPSASTIAGEACQVIKANGGTPDPGAIYFVYTSNFPSGTNYCAWHSYGSCDGVTIQVAYMPNTTGIAGCDPGNQYHCNTYSQGTRSLANVTSHEYMEAITDPRLNAWYDLFGSEIGDKCAWTFSSCVNLTNDNWQLQREWSNAVSGCVQQLQP